MREFNIRPHYLLVLMFLFAAAAVQAQNIQTVAGGGPNNVAAVDANLGAPLGVALDGAGNFYIASRDGNRVYKVDSAGQLTIVAGNGTPSYSGDGGPASSAGLNYPVGLVVDSAGNLYIADKGNQRIRKVDMSGNISTVAGNGTAGYNGDNIAATRASLYFPQGVAADGAGNLYIADTYNQRVRKVDSSGNISTVAGNGNAGYGGDGGAAITASFNYPTGVAVDNAGDIFIADTDNYRIRKVNTSGNISTVAGNGSYGYSGDGGLATSASLYFTVGVAVDNDGNFYITDLYSERIRKVDTSGIISTVAGNGGYGFSGDGGPATSARLFDPYGLAVDSAGNLYIADTSNQRIRKVDTSGNISTVAGDGTLGDGRAATSASLAGPFGVAVDNAGNLFIADTSNHRIRKVDASGIITTVAGNGSHCYYTTDLCGDGGPAISANLYDPYDVAVDHAGNIYIADLNDHRIRKVDTAGNISTVAGNGTPGYSGDGGPATSASLYYPSGVAVDAAGNLYIADTSNQRIRKVDTSGNISTVAGNGTASYSGDGGAATSASLSAPLGVAVDSAGNLYIADSGNNRIRKVDLSGNISTVAGNGMPIYNGDNIAATSARLYYPYDVAVDGAGDLYIADTSNQRIRKVDTSGIITTVAGNGSYGYGGDGGPSTSAMVAAPRGVAVNGAGDIFIADTSNQRIRKATTFVPFVAVSVSPASIDFGEQAVGSQSTPQTVTVSNSGTVDLQQLFVHVVEGSFLATGDCFDLVLAPGDSCTSSVSFLPTATGSSSGTLEIVLNNGEIIKSIPLFGTGIAPVPAVTLSSTSLTFSNQAVGTTSTTQPITLTSSGTSALTLGSITASGDFALATTATSCPYGGGVIAVGVSCTIDVTFAPAQIGTRGGSITITDDAAGGSQTISLTGTAVAAPTGPLNGLVSYWNFDESSGKAIDIIGGNNGTLGPAVTRVPGIVGSGAVEFSNTSGDYIDIGLASSNAFAFTTGMTVSAIIKPQWSGAFLDYEEIFRKEDGDNRILFSFQNDNGIGGGTGPVLSFGIKVGGVYDELDMELDGQNGRPTLAQLEDGNPHYVVASYNSVSGLKAIYVDGTLRDSISYPAGTLMASGGPCNAAIGNFSCGFFHEPFTGTIDEVRVYNRALTSAEIAAFAGVSPVPSISQPLVPAATAPGGADFTLTVNGTGFTSHSVVNWNGTPLATTFVSSTQLTAVVPAGNIAAAGTASITVFTPTPGGGTSNVAYFDITVPSGLAFARTDLTTCQSTISVRTGDFNGDGKLDIAATTLGCNDLEILPGNADGTFQQASSFPAGAGPFELGVGDFDGDGIADLAVADANVNDLSILRSNGNGSFQSPISVAAGNVSESVAVGDFNGDGLMDVAVPNFYTNDVSVVLGKVKVTFQDAATYPVGGTPLAIAAGDFDGDGNLDLVTANSSTDNISILLGKGDGTFHSAANIAVGAFPQAVAVGDINGDGKPDLAVANFNSANVSILLGDGNGNFQLVANRGAGFTPAGLAMGDINGDGYVDIAVVNEFINTIRILFGDGQGHFPGSMINIPVGTDPTSVALGDFNGDGKIDLAVANDGADTVTVLLQAPVVSLSASSLDFGNLPTGTTSAAQTVTITNSGAVNLNISNIEFTGANPGDFGFTSGQLPISVTPGNKTTVQVTFTPTAGGSRSATLSLTDNAGNSPQSIALSGTGLTPQQVTQDNIEQVNTLYSQGVITSGQDNSLVKELQKAIDMMNKGKINGAISNLEDFIIEVNDLLNSGVLTPDQASSLINAANVVIAQLQTS